MDGQTEIKMAVDGRESGVLLNTLDFILQHTASHHDVISAYVVSELFCDEFFSLNEIKRAVVLYVPTPNFLKNKNS